MKTNSRRVIISVVDRFQSDAQTYAANEGGMFLEGQLKSRIKQSIIMLVIGIVANVTLVAVKLYVGMTSNSLTIMLDATNSIFDVLTSIITLFAFVALYIPRSEDAPFGYGRSEYLAGFVVAVASAVIGGLFFMRSLNRLAMPEPVWFGWQNCVLISIAIPIKIALAVFYHVKNKKIKSKAIAAIALDCCLDIGITGASLVAFAVTSEVDYAADAIFGIVISVAVLVFAVKMIADNIKSVVKGDGSKEEYDIIKSELKADARIKRIGNITLHDYGFGAKAGTAEVVFEKGVTLDSVKQAEREIRDAILAQCGAEIWLVPLSDEDLSVEKERKKRSPRKKPQIESAEENKDISQNQAK
ncbi:MAG: cation diffusion facilitator family transporter [Bacteroides sp.]|nr:cation diffusion facilitator family transporter [Bacillota bacterium]MCM1393411.1 cation diffusion facilitator family transporter [[Eubacterium] siraeum]MCM1455397.1 cation diffusion facilitator family transporter [Bacteroides sp.]